jgi:hypothetical protein
MLHPSASFRPMKLLRLWLIVLLAALLPVRGAMAAAMLCPAMGTGMATELRSPGHEGHGHEHASEAHAHHHHEGAADPDHAQASGHDQCNLCSAFCSITPLLSAMPSVPPPLEAATASYPDFSAPAPSFVSDGQERPPRSI